MSCHEGGADCRTALSNLYLFLDRELDDATWDEIHAHIADCEPCLSAFDMEMLVKQIVSRSCAEKAPPVLRERVLMEIRSVSIHITDER